MKKIFVLFLCVFLIAAFSVTATAANASAMLELSRSPEMSKGDTVTLTAAFSEAVEVSAMWVEISFDSSAIEIVSGDWLLANASTKSFNSQERAGNLAYSPAETVNGRFFQFTLKIKDDAAFGSYEVGFNTIVKDAESADVPCNSLGTTLVVKCSHDWKTEWSKDGNSHWYDCNICTEKKEMGAHSFDNDCDTLCESCGFSRNTEHSYSEAWTFGADSHWHECTSCGNKKDEASHIYDDGCDATCNECSAVRTAAHTPTEAWIQGETTHWHICGLCNEKAEEEAHVFDNNCDNECNVCKKTRVITHSYSTKWTANKTKHWHVCTSCGEKTDEAAHTPKNVVSQKFLKSAANCVSKAVYYKSCSVCGQALNETFESGEKNPNVHTGNEEFKEAVEATCKQPGNTGDKYCKDCQTKLADGEPVLAGHKLKKVEKVQSTCNNEGNIEYYRCEGICGKLFEDAEGNKEITDSMSILIEKIAHTVSVVDRVEPTLQKEGMEKHFKCDVCGKAFEDSEGEKEITDLSALVIDKKISTEFKEKPEKKTNLFLVIVAFASLASSLVAIPIIIKHKR